TGVTAGPTLTVRSLMLQSNGWCTLPAYPGFVSPLTVLGDALIDTGAGFNGDGLGNTSGGNGLGGSQNVSGVYYGGGGGHGGYGGSGGHTIDRGGGTYDSLTAPASAGSSG